MELLLQKTEIPKVIRVGGSGREGEKWEDLLAPLKAEPGQGYLLLTYASRASAISRMTSIRKRLEKMTPNDDWTLNVRPVPDHAESHYGVYGVYNGTISDAQVAERTAERAERSAKVIAARAANANTTPSTDGNVTEPSAKERVAAARTAKKAS